MSRRWWCAAAVLLTGCALPDEVRQFTGVALEATLQVKPVLQDIPSACVRGKRAEEGAGTFELNDEAAVAGCKELSDLEPQLQIALAVLGDYLKALQKLAAGETVSNEADVVVTRVKSVGKFNGAAADAVQGLAKFLVKAAVSHYQTKQLAGDIREADKDVAKLTETLEAILSEDYGLTLDREEGSEQDRYRLVSARGGPAQDKAVAILLQDRWHEVQDRLAAKRASSRDARRALQEIRTGHQILAAHAAQMKDANLLRALQTHSFSLQKLVADLRKEL